MEESAGRWACLGPAAIEMKPLFHPAADDVTVEGILHALADPVRVHIFAQILQADCPLTCSPFLEISDRSVPKSTLSQHFKVLRDAGLIRSERKGVEMHNVTRIDEIGPRYGALIRAIIDAHTEQVARQKKRRRKAA